MFSLLNTATSAVNRSKEMTEDFCGNSFFPAEDSLMSRMRTENKCWLTMRTDTIQVLQSQVSNEAKHYFNE